jgi:DNA-binding IclR family transcriptional regulator
MNNSYAKGIRSYMNSEGVRHTVPALRNAIRVLEAVAAEGVLKSSPQIARHLRLSPSSCYRILQTLQAADWVRATDDGGYEVSFGLLPLARPLLAWDRATRAIQTDLDRLAGETNLSVKVSARQGLQQITIARAESPQHMAPLGRTGSRFPVVWGSSGAALLTDASSAELKALADAIPDADWNGLTPGEFCARVEACRVNGAYLRGAGKDSSICTISAPIRNTAGAVVVALTLVGLPEDFESRRHPELRRALLRAVKVMSPAFAELPAEQRGNAVRP